MININENYFGLDNLSHNQIETLSTKEQGIIARYATDIYRMVAEVYRVLANRGLAVFVVGNSCLRSVFIENAALVSAAAQQVGLIPTGRQDRELPPNRRYLPPPTEREHSVLEKRMRSETVLRFAKA